MNNKNFIQNKISDSNQLTNIPLFLNKNIDTDIYLSKNLHDQHIDNFVNSSIYSITDLNYDYLHNKFPYEIEIKLKTYDVFLSIDSRYRDRSYDIQNGLRFNIALNQQSSIYGNLGINYPLDKIKEIEIMNSFMFPKKFNDQTTYLNFDDYDEITLSINEMQIPSVRGINNRYHFSFKIDQSSVLNDQARVLLDIPYNPVFRLVQPFNLDRTLTLQFNSPNNNIVLDDDNFSVYIGYTNPGTFTVNGLTNLLKLPNLINGDSICFEDFTTSDFLFNNTNPNSIVYQEKFYTVTKTNDPFTYSIPLDLTNIFLTIDPNRPSEDPINSIPYTIFDYYGQENNYLVIFNSSPSPLCSVGDTVYIYKFIPGQVSPPYLNPQFIQNIYIKSGFTINAIESYSGGYNYKFVFNLDTYPIYLDSTTSGGIFYVTFNTFYPYPETKNAKIYVGSKRIRIPLRFEVLRGDK
jgi:hypothetical protein